MILLFYNRMASKCASRPLLGLTTARVFRLDHPIACRRFLSSFQRPAAPSLTRASTKSMIKRSTFQQSFRRPYAEAASPKPRSRLRSFFRWTWRLTYLSAIGGLGYLIYTIYMLRTPSEQYAPDPSKKTLVILGEPYWSKTPTKLTMHRYWLGFCLLTKET